MISNFALIQARYVTFSFMPLPCSRLQSDGVGGLVSSLHCPLCFCERFGVTIALATQNLVHVDVLFPCPDTTHFLVLAWEIVTLEQLLGKLILNFY